MYVNESIWTHRKIDVGIRNIVYYKKHFEISLAFESNNNTHDIFAKGFYKCSNTFTSYCTCVQYVFFLVCSYYITVFNYIPFIMHRIIFF